MSRTRRGVVLGWGIALLLPCAAMGRQAAPATQPATEPSEAAENLAEIAAIKGLGGLKPARLRDVVALRVGADRRLDVTTTLPPSEGEKQQPFTDDPGTAKVSFIGSGENTSITLTCWRAGAGAQSMERYEVMGSRVGAMTILRNTFSARGDQSIELFQSPPNMDADDAEHAIRLTVTDGTTKTLEVTAKDAPSLVKRYPGITARYLRPMLRGLRMDEALFAGSVKEALEVLAADLPADAAARAKVEAALPKLDADAASDREAGQKALAELGQTAANVLFAYDRGKLTPQQYAEVDTFLAAYSPLSAEDAAAARASADRLASYLSLEDATVRRLAYARLKGLAKDVPEFDPEGAAEARAKQVAAIEEFLVPSAPTTQPK